MTLTDFQLEILESKAIDEPPSELTRAMYRAVQEIRELRSELEKAKQNRTLSRAKMGKARKCLE